MTDINVDGTVIAGSVAEVIMCMAATEVEGIAAVGGMDSGSVLKGIFSCSKELAPIEIETGEDNGLYIGLHVEVFFGYPLPEVAERVRASVAEAVCAQLGAKVDQIDVFVDGIKFVD